MRTHLAYLLRFIVPAICLTAGCATSPPPLEIDVPYVAQSPYECGVATLQMAFERQGIEYDEERLQKRVFIPALNGTTIGVMAKAAREFGAKATVDTGNNHTLAAWLDRGLSPIILWGPKDGEKIGHFLVVTAITTSHDSMRVHSGLSSDKWIPFREFMKRWEEGGYRILLVEAGDSGPQAPKVGTRPLAREASEISPLLEAKSEDLEPSKVPERDGAGHLIVNRPVNPREQAGDEKENE